MAHKLYNHPKTKELFEQFESKMSFELHPEANPPSRKMGLKRFQARMTWMREFSLDMHCNNLVILDLSGESGEELGPENPGGRGEFQRRREADSESGEEKKKERTCL